MADDFSADGGIAPMVPELLVIDFDRALTYVYAMQ